MGRDEDKVNYLPAIVVVIVVLTIVGVGVYFALENGSKAEFEVTSLALSPAETKVGQTVTVSVAVKNTGDNAGTHKVVLTIDGEEAEAKEVTLAVGETKTVTFTIMKNTEGIFTVGAGGLSKSLEVRTLIPAEFVISNLSFNPSEVEVGKPVVISTTVKNVGDLEGTYTVELKIDGETQETKKVTLAGGELQTVSFTVTKDTSGTYTIGVNGLQRVLSVLEPATFELTNLTISPTEVEPGATVTISVIVKNIGNLEGGYTVELNIDGVVEATKDVTLTGGATETVSFTVTKNESKTYDVSIDELTDSFSVVPISELLSASLYPSIIIGDCVHDLGFSLFNGSSQTITVVSAEFFDESGNITHTISTDDIAEIWGTGDVKAGESFSGGISFRSPYFTGELEGWWVKWYCLDTNGVEFTVTGTYSSL